jgi:hypothetical protein
MRGLRVLLIVVALVLVAPSMMVQAASPVASPGATKPKDPLAARLGGSQKSFEAIWGKGEINQKSSTDTSTEIDYKQITDQPFVEIWARFYKNKSAWTLFVFSPRPGSKLFSEPDPADWTMEQATTIAQRFLPADAKLAATSLHEDPTSGKQTMRCSSAALKKTFSSSVYQAFPSTAPRGDCEVAFTQNAAGTVPYLIVRLAEYARPPKIKAPLTSDEKSYLDHLKTDVAQVEQSYQMFADEMSSGSPQVVNILTALSLWQSYAANVDSRLDASPERLSSLDHDYRAALGALSEAGGTLSTALNANDQPTIGDAIDAIVSAHLRVQTVWDQATVLSCCAV